MSDDIVTRLRERAIVLFSNGADGNAFIDEEAADEIERELWRERCEQAEECLDLIYRKKRRWRLW